MKRRAAIRLTDEERDAFLDQPLNCTLATIGRRGFPQLTAMWYVLIDGKFHFATYGKSQKIRNLERNPKCAVLVEDGQRYEVLRGYSVEGEAEIIEDHDLAAAVLIGCSARYMGLEVATAPPVVLEQLRARAKKRKVIRVHPEKEISWDHRKLGGAY